MVWTFSRIERRLGSKDDGKTAHLPIPRGQRRELSTVGTGGDVMLRGTARADAAGGEGVEGLAAGAAPKIAHWRRLAAGGAVHRSAANRRAIGVENFRMLLQNSCLLQAEVTLHGRKR